jgi:HSP20 family protein
MPWIPDGGRDEIRYPITRRMVSLMDTQAQPAQEYLGQDISDWPGSPLSTIHPFEPVQLPVRTEEYTRDGRHVMRFELPGTDPANDVGVSIEAQVLTVHAKRAGGSPVMDHSDFRYGNFTSRLTLPGGTDNTDVIATYENGILEVTVGFEDKAKDAPREIPVRITHS